MTDVTTPAIAEPAAYLAAARCLAARSIGKGVTRQHARACSWCDLPLDWLREAVDAYTVFSGWDEKAGTYERHEDRVFTEFMRRSPAEAEAQVVAAQGFEDIGQGGSDPRADLPLRTALAATSGVEQVRKSASADSEPAPATPDPTPEEVAAWS